MRAAPPAPVSARRAAGELARQRCDRVARIVRVAPSTFLSLAAALLLTLLAAALPAGARAAFTATVRDPAGDATSPDPGHDLLAASVGYDRRTGFVAGAVQLRAAPREGRAFLHFQIGRLVGGRCEGTPVLGIGSYTDDFDATWLRFAAPDQVTARGEADKDGRNQPVQSFEARARALRGLRPDCALVLLSEPTDSANVYDAIGPFRLVPRPGLSMRLGGVPEDVRSGRSYTLKVTVTNPGEARTPPIQVRLRRAKGIAGTPKTVRLKPLRPGARATARFTIRPRENARFATELDVTATSGQMRVAGTRKIYVSTPSPPSRGGGGGGGGEGSRLCVRFIPDLSGESGGSLGLVPC